MSKGKGKKLDPVSNVTYSTKISKVISARAAHLLNWYSEPPCGVSGLKVMMNKIIPSSVYTFPSYVFLYQKQIQQGQTVWQPVNDVISNFNIDADLDSMLKNSNTDGVTCCTRYMCDTIYPFYQNGVGRKHPNGLCRYDMVGGKPVPVSADVDIVYFPNFIQGEYAIIFKGLFRKSPDAWSAIICYEAKLFDVKVDESRASGGGWADFVNKHPHLFDESVYVPDLPLPLPVIPQNQGLSRTRELFPENNNDLEEGIILEKDNGDYGLN